MSVVTGVMLISGLLDSDDAVPEVNRWLADRGWPALKEISDHAGGGKHPQFDAWSAGINYFLDAEGFAEFVLTRQWKQPESAVLIMQPEDGCTRVFRPGNLQVGQPPASEAEQR